MTLCNQSCLTLFFVACLATPLFASPLFFSIFSKGNSSRTTTTTTTTASPNDFDIDFSVSSADETRQPSLFDRVGSIARLVSALLKSFITVITNRQNSGETRSIEELATEDTLAGVDPFGVEPSENEIDFFATLDSPGTTSGASSGRSVDSNANSGSPSSDQTLNEGVKPSGPVVDAKVDSTNSGSSDLSANPELSSSDITRAILLGSTRLA